MSQRTPEAEPLLTPAEVGTMFRVDPKTVTRWAKAGKLNAIFTLGGHRRYREAEVRALLAAIPQRPAAKKTASKKEEPAIPMFRVGLTGSTVTIEHGSALVRKDGHLEGVLDGNAKGAALRQKARTYAASIGAEFVEAAS